MPPVDRKQPTRQASSESTYTLMDFMREFPDDDACLEWLWRNRYSEDGEHAHCPKCDTERAFKRYVTAQRRQSWTCTACGLHIHPTAGTIFHKSSTSLHLWFYAMYLMTSTRCGISAKQMERELGVTYKTAWRMANLIRNELMDQESEVLEGAVEIDETYIGGRRRGSRGGRPAAGDPQKTPVLGMVEREGRVVAMTVENVRTATLMPQITKRVLPEAVVYTDELKSYDQLVRHGYEHNRIYHGAGVYVSGTIHTNTIEGFWSLVKRGIGGVYHSVSQKHLQGYLNEYAWRYSNRHHPEGLFRLILLRAADAIGPRTA